MIRFNKGAVNNVVVTLTENSTAANPIYLFLFTNQQSNVNYFFIATDTSQYKERYNQFSVTEKMGANTLNGEVDLGNEGFYNYTVYQTSLSSLSGLTTAADAVDYIVKTVEVGLVWVVPVATSNTKYTPQSNTSVVYSADMALLDQNNLVLTDQNNLILLEN